MIEINVKTNFAAIMKDLAQLPQKIADRVTVRALNTTIDQGKTEMAREISRVFRIPVGQAKARLAVRKASFKGDALRLEAMLEATRKGKGRSMNLIAFQTGALTKRTAKKAGRANAVGQIGFQIKRDGGRKVIPGAFIGNKGRTMFIRTGKPRLPIAALNTIDIPQMFNTRRINQIVREVMKQRFVKNFNRELASARRGFLK